MSSMTFNMASVPQGIYDTSTSQLAPMGSTVFLGDGREFQYAENGAVAAINGRGYQASVGLVVADTVDKALSTQAAGDLTVTFTPTGTDVLAENEAAEGYLVITDDTGDVLNAGPTYKISSHLAMAAATAVVLRLQDPLWEGIAAASLGTIVKHPCRDVVIWTPGSAGATRRLVGIPPRDHAVDAFGWFQTKGTCGALRDGTVAVGNPVVLSDGVDGAVSPLTATQAIDETELGDCMVIAADANICIINLRLS